MVALFDGREITEADLEVEPLNSRILGPLLDRYRALHGIEATPFELESFLRSSADRNQDREDESKVEVDPELDAQMDLDLAQWFVLQWKTSRSLYEQYGGRVIWEQVNPLVPVDALYAYLREQERAGVFRIDDEDLAAEFWHYYLPDDDGWWRVPEERIDYSRPWWEQRDDERRQSGPQ